MPPPETSPPETSPPETSPAGRTRVLLVCTGNLCRSPMAAALLARRLERRRIDAEVSSRGILEGGVACPPEVTKAMETYGLDLSAHRSRQVSPGDLEAADLVLAMEHAQLRELAVLSPASRPRSFTVRELLRRAGELGPRPDGTSFADWVEQLAHARPHAGLARWTSAEDIKDPMGRKLAVHEQVAAELAVLTGELVALAWPGRR